MSKHVVLGKNVYHCLHCGAQFALQLPMTLNMLSATSSAFIKDHEACPPPAPTQGTNHGQASPTGGDDNVREVPDSVQTR